MKLRATILALVIGLISMVTMAQGPGLTGRDGALAGWTGVQVASVNEPAASLAPSAGVNQHKPATVSSQAGETTQEGNTLRLVLLALLVMGSIALRRSRSAR